MQNPRKHLHRMNLFVSLFEEQIELVLGHRTNIHFVGLSYYPIGLFFF
jgi:hypothetical protein